MKWKRERRNLNCFVLRQNGRGVSAYTTGWAIKIKIELISERQTAYTQTHIHFIITEIGRKANVGYSGYCFWVAEFTIEEQMKSERADDQTNEKKIVNDYKRVSGDNER